MNHKIKAIIVDDEMHARAALRGIIEENFSNSIQIVDEAKDLPGAVKIINKEKPDLVFLDVEMPGHSGLELLDFFNEDEIWFDIIFVTAYQQYAINAFKLSAVDYLLKPVKIQDVENSIRLLERKHLRISDEEKNLSKSLHVLKNNMLGSSFSKIVLPTSDGLMVENLSDIIYIKADGSYVNFIFEKKNKIMLAKKLMDYDYLENGFGFFRIHRSYIVNINHIKKILKGESKIIMSNGDELSITPEKRNLLVDIFEKN